MSPERRYLPAADLRMDEAGDRPVIRGYAAVFNSLSEDLGGFREIIAPGAFQGALGEDIRALWNHDSNHVIGRTAAGTLMLEEDDKGLRVEIQPPESAGWMVESIRRGDVTQMSFGFRTLRDDWANDDGEVIRTLQLVRLIEVSPVAFPAYPETEAAMRALDAFRDQSAPPDFTTLRARLRVADASLV